MRRAGRGMYARPLCNRHAINFASDITRACSCRISARPSEPEQGPSSPPRSGDASSASQGCRLAVAGCYVCSARCDVLHVLQATAWPAWAKGMALAIALLWSLGPARAARGQAGARPGARPGPSKSVPLRDPKWGPRWFNLDYNFSLLWLPGVLQQGGARGWRRVDRQRDGARSACRGAPDPAGFPLILL